MSAPTVDLPRPHLQRTRRRADIQGLRALAVLLVVAYHAGLPVPGGFVGVDVFFVISGFVITAMLVAELESTGRLDLPRFYVRRARRLLPALAVMLTSVLALAALLSPIAAQRMTALTGVTASLFAANGYLLGVGTGYFDVGTDLNPLLHTWTLGVEEQFYVAFPVLLLLGWWLARRTTGPGRGAAAALVALASVGSLVAFVALGGGWVSDPGTSRLAFFASPTRAWEFGVGALLALAAPWIARLPWRSWALGLVGVAAVGAAAFFDLAWASHGPVALAAVVGAGALIAAGTASTGGPSRALGVRPAVWLGDLSYSWYLWHWPLIVFATALWPAAGWAAPTAAALSLVPAWLSYRFVENPVRFGERWRVRRPALAALAFACILAPVAAALGLLRLESALASTATMQSWARSQQAHADVVNRCDSLVPLLDRPVDTCTWRAPAARGRIVLVGDSNAGHFTEAVVAAARRAGYDLTVVTSAGCPFVGVDVVRTSDPRRETACRRFRDGTLAGILQLEPSLVVTAARSDKYVEDAEYRLRDHDGRLTGNPDRRALLWREGLETTLATLGGAGVPVLVVHPVPAFAAKPHGCSTLALVTRGCASTLPVASVDARLLRARTAERAAVAASANGFALDLRDAICLRGRCSSTRGSTILYRDGEHLSVAGSMTLGDEFFRAITAALADTPG